MDPTMPCNRDRLVVRQVLVYTRCFVKFSSCNGSHLSVSGKGVLNYIVHKIEKVDKIVKIDKQRPPKFRLQ